MIGWIALAAGVNFTAGFLFGAAWAVRARSDFIHSLMAEEASVAERDAIHEVHNG